LPCGFLAPVKLPYSGRTQSDAAQKSFRCTSCSY
jgi:hypothetical protein